jgi:hypothetical protein
MGNNNAQFLVLHNFSVGGFRGFGTDDGESDAEQERNWGSLSYPVPGKRE